MRMAMLKQIGQTVRLRSCNHIVTVPGMSTPPEDLGAEFLRIPKSHKIVFPGLEFGSKVSRNDYVPSYGSLILGFIAS
ncbi:hypothetical protein Bca101_058413 [Brassica carinata]